MCLTNSGRSQRYNWSIGRPAPPLHQFYIFDKTRPVERYISSISRPAPPLHSFYIFEISRPVPEVHQECSSACTTFAFILYIRKIPAGSRGTTGVLVGLHHLCMHFIFLANPGRSTIYIRSISQPAPPLHSFYVFDKLRPVPEVQLEY